ncbi:MAG: substrate-binding domain-containing protein [Verrucomicrobiota bacterium]
MKKSAASSPKPSQRLEVHLRACARGESWPVENPLPTTRDLAAEFGVSAATAFRLLQALAAENLFWQHTSGRFYRAAARPILDRPRPVACLIRRLELCSALYREMLEGISAGSGEARRAMLLWHDDVLVNHADPARPPVFAKAGAQRLLLDGFLERHGGDAGGYLLDHVWSDAVLAQAGTRIAPAVLLFRRAPAGLPLGNVRADFDSAAMQALAHLLGRGFTKIVPVEPFAGDPAVEEFFAALEKAAETMACANRLAARARASTPGEAAALVKGLSRKTRTALLVPEDHVAVRLHGMLTEAGRVCPDNVGLLAVMGTAVGEQAGLSRLAFDFRAMGRMAVSLLAEPTPRTEVFPAVLRHGIST